MTKPDDVASSVTRAERATSLKQPRALEQQRALASRNYHPSSRWRTFHVHPSDTLLDGLRRTVVRHPDRIAIQDPVRMLTYGDVDMLSNSIAWAIVDRLGAGWESVGLMMPRNASALPVTFGILKAGKAYVLLNPSYPPSHIAYIIQDAGIRLLIASRDAEDELAALGELGCQLLFADDFVAENAQLAPAHAVSADTIAHIAYTSGSTGKPKGVVYTHSFLAYHVMNEINTHHFCPEDRLVESGALILEFASTLAGASIWPFDIRASGFQGLTRWLIDNRITYLVMVTSVFRRFVQALPPSIQLDSLRLVSLGGEPLYAADIIAARKHLGKHCVINHHLGLSEARTIRHLLVDPWTLDYDGQLPVGYPTDDKDVLIVDSERRVVGTGEVGEIAVRSAHLATGYWRQPELTQQRFRADPDDETKRIYYSGDMGRIDAEGCLWHEGRSDFQAKIRGYRVETAAVEAALLDMAAVQDAAVAARNDPADDELALVAYLVVEGSQPTVSALRSFLMQRLPDYMVPSRFVFLSALPLTPIGKVDRQRLPAPDTVRPQLDVPYAAPQSPIEVTLASIWAESLGLDQVGVHDAVVDQGGHSLSAMRVVGRVADTFGVDVPLVKLLEASTVAQMALVIVSRLSSSSDAAAKFLDEANAI